VPVYPVAVTSPELVAVVLVVNGCGSGARTVEFVVDAPKTLTTIDARRCPGHSVR
jgi:hypothetical protein